ncbi:ArnT family glycosyltransferase [Lacunimicrobium album]
MPQLPSPVMALIIIAIVALTIRVGFGIAIQRQLDSQPGRFDLIEGDASGYWMLAQKIVTGQPYEIYNPPRQVHRMPGFPAILATSIAFFGDKPFPARMLLAVIGTASCMMVYVLTWQLFNTKIAFTAGMWAAISLPLAIFSVVFLSETAFAFAVLINLSFFIAWWKAKSVRSQILFAILTGIGVALATYQRPSWYPMIVLFALASFFRSFSPGEKVAESNRQVRKSILPRSDEGSLQTDKKPSFLIRLLPCFTLFLAFTLSMAPWVYRNYEVTNKFILTTLWMGPSLYDGFRPDATGDSDMRFFEEDNLMATMSEYEMDQEYKRRGWNYAFSHPAHAIELAFIKAYRYWKPWPNASQFGGLGPTLAVAVHATPLLLLAVLGAWWAFTSYEFSREQKLLIAVVTIAPITFFGLLHMLFVSSLRYRLPLEYPLMSLSAYALHLILGSLTKASKTSQIPA